MAETVTTHIEAIAAHRPYGMNCKCGRGINSDEDWARHFIEEVFENEWCPATIEHDGYVDADTQWTYDNLKDAKRFFGDGIASRLVTPWMKEEP